MFIGGVNMDTVTRKIHFFKIKMSSYNRTRNTTETIDDQMSVSTQIANQINSLPFANSGLTRYFEIGSGNVLFMLIDLIGTHIAGRLITSRRNLLPEVESQGQLTPLVIPTQAGLAETTHFVYFPREQILGLEFNFFGPRAPKFGDYLQVKTPDIVNIINLEHILNLDVTEKLNNMGEVSLLQIEAHRNAVDILRNLDESLGTAFEAAANLSEAETVEIILRKKRYSKRGFEFPFSPRRLLETLTGNNREVFYNLKGSAFDNNQGQNIEFDLLEDKMIVSKRVVRLNDAYKSINTDSMHSAILEAFEEMRDQLIIER